ncbi:hypothetical protein HDU86_004429 [Geranomyces michiganensis]|nr:hypothetical protein HDU86_004429 [Geranomyces michiganensis]
MLNGPPTTQRPPPQGELTSFDDVSTTAADVASLKATLIQPQSNLNAFDIHCPKCRCLVIRRGVATQQDSDQKVELPPPAATSAKYPLVPAFSWMLSNMMAFENIGFTKAVPGGDDTRYLSCADCDVGPLGYHPPTLPKTFLIAADRVRYNMA